LLQIIRVCSYFFKLCLIRCFLSPFSFVSFCNLFVNFSTRNFINFFLTWILLLFSFLFVISAFNGSLFQTLFWFTSFGLEFVNENSTQFLYFLKTNFLLLKSVSFCYHLTCLFFNSQRTRFILVTFPGLRFLISLNLLFFPLLNHFILFAFLYLLYCLVSFRLVADVWSDLFLHAS
jgi:hypothetical protein